MRLRYSATARSQIDAIFDYLVERNPAAARRITGEIRASAGRLASFPHIGRPGTAAGSREWVVRGSPYVIVYQVDTAKDEILVLGVFHGAQDWQNQDR